MSNHYLTNRVLYPPQLEQAPVANLGIVVVIPCFNEPDLLSSLQSLLEAKRKDYSIEVIVVINNSAEVEGSVKKQNLKTYNEAIKWAERYSTSNKQFHILYQADLPPKKAGVGLARKIGMDEAVRRLEAVQNPSGIITGYDADSKCDPNYFIAIEKHFQQYPFIQAASIYYEHPLSGDLFDQKIYHSIIQYELHLRYFTLAKRYANYPHAFETIGSSMAVRCNAYQEQGGMNTRKAGEDFYFLNKFMVLGKLNELNTTRVIPSPRISDRVPFGTGKAVGELSISSSTLKTYHFQSFIDLKTLIEAVPAIYGTDSFDYQKLPQLVRRFFEFIQATDRINEIKQNTSDFDAFEKRFFRWFDPFMIMKYVHFARDHFYPNIDVIEAGRWILQSAQNEGVKEELGEKELLEAIRLKWKN